MKYTYLIFATIFTTITTGCLPETTQSSNNISINDSSSSEISSNEIYSSETSLSSEENIESSELFGSSNKETIPSPEANLENTIDKCTDGIDNDNNGFVDCAEKTCNDFVQIDCRGREDTEKQCQDGIDNDADGYIDCADKQCQPFDSCGESTVETCTDGVDNDGDGLTDCEDVECLQVLAGKCGELTRAICEDNIDNDGDGYIDCNDSDCAMFEDICPYQAPSAGPAGGGNGSGVGDGNGSGGGAGLTLGSSGNFYPGSETFSSFQLGGFVATVDDNQSTFGLDVDAASYTFARSRILDYAMVPDSQAVRTEEFINYFEYDYPEPEEGVFTILTDIAESPFRDSVSILRVGLKAHTPSVERVPWNLTFLLDISGSMRGRIDLVKESLYVLIDNMQEGDYLSITTYAGSVSTVLNPISLKDSDREAIKGLLKDLTTGGGTAMGDGMTNAYTVNRSAFLSDGVNRVIVCSDGDANIGSVRGEEMLTQIQEYVDGGIMMSTLGFGIGNFQDATMEKLANKGNGNYYYIDGIKEAQRIFGKKIAATIEAVAIDTKIQLEFDTQKVKRYRLLGYENRDIADELFEVDTTDAGEIGPGHTVTALYELVMNDENNGTMLGSVRIRYQNTKGTSYEESSTIVVSDNTTFESQDDDFKFAALVGEYSDVLRKTPHSHSTLAGVLSYAQQWQLDDNDERKEFYEILESVAGLELSSEQPVQYID
ncbi:MAG: von Willebrand factor type A domain-containing protein [Fibrobacterales bacterium]